LVWIDTDMGFDDILAVMMVAASSKPVAGVSLVFGNAPMDAVRANAADFVRGQVSDAVAAGAKALIDAKHFPADAQGTPYLAPQFLVDVDHSKCYQNGMIYALK